jgi:anti-sigma regulatory factor (Ser/Thr protein kinase)
MLAMEEIVTNAIVHGGGPAGTEPLTVRVTLDGKLLSCEIIDSGRPFDPFKDAPAPDLHSALADRPIGGLGVHLARQVTDGHSYRRFEDRNHTVLIKRLG